MFVDRETFGRPRTRIFYEHRSRATDGHDDDSPRPVQRDGPAWCYGGRALRDQFHLECDPTPGRITNPTSLAIRRYLCVVVGQIRACLRARVCRTNHYSRRVRHDSRHAVVMISASFSHRSFTTEIRTNVRVPTVSYRTNTLETHEILSVSPRFGRYSGFRPLDKQYDKYHPARPSRTCARDSAESTGLSSGRPCPIVAAIRVLSLWSLSEISSRPDWMGPEFLFLLCVDDAVRSLAFGGPFFETARQVRHCYEAGMKRAYSLPYGSRAAPKRR